MTKKIITFLWAFCFLLAGNGEAFIPDADHLLYMVLKKIGQPVGIEVIQNRKILNYSETASKGFTLLEEKLTFACPDRLRAQVISEAKNTFTLDTKSGFIKVRENELISEHKSLTDLYTDILLYRDYQMLLDYLKRMGINTGKIRLERYRDTICYVIGSIPQKDNSINGLWIEKDTFFPLKFGVEKDGWKVEFNYGNWQRVSRTWYPRQVSIFLDDQLFCLIDVTDMILTSGFSDDMFDISRIVKGLPAMQTDTVIHDNDTQVDELDRRMKDLGKLLD